MTETDELLQTGTDWHQRIWQNVEKFKIWNTVEFQPRRQIIGGSKDKRKESRERSTKGSWISLKWKVLWSEMACGTLREKNPEEKGRVSKRRR